MNYDHKPNLIFHSRILFIIVRHNNLFFTTAPNRQGTTNDFRILIPPPDMYFAHKSGFKLT